MKQEEQKSGENTKKDKKETFWTVCQLCYLMYEYKKRYEGCCLRCQNQKCRRAFKGVAVLKPKKDNFPFKYFLNDGTNATNDVIDKNDGEAIGVRKEEEDVVKENSISGDKVCLGVMQGSEEINGGLDLNVKFEQVDADVHEIKIEGGTGNDYTDLKFFEKEGDVFVPFKFDK